MPELQRLLAVVDQLEQRLAAHEDPGVRAQAVFVARLGVDLRRARRPDGSLLEALVSEAPSTTQRRALRALTELEVSLGERVGRIEARALFDPAEGSAMRILRELGDAPEGSLTAFDALVPFAREPFPAVLELRLHDEAGWTQVGVFLEDRDEPRRLAPQTVLPLGLDAFLRVFDERGADLYPLRLLPLSNGARARIRADARPSHAAPVGNRSSSAETTRRLSLTGRTPRARTGG